MPGWDKLHYNRTIGAMATPPEPVAMMAVWWWWDTVLTPEELARGAEELGPGAFASDLSDVGVGKVLSEHLGLEKRCLSDLKKNLTWAWVVRFPGVDCLFKNQMTVSPTLASMAGTWLKSTTWWRSNLAEMKRIKARVKKVQSVLKP